MFELPVWDLLQSIYQTRPAATRAYHQSPSPVQQLVDEFGVPPYLIGGFLYMVENYNTARLSAAHYWRRNCYESLTALEELLVTMAEADLIAPNGTAGEYAVTPKGQQLVARADQLLRPRWSLPPVEGTALTQALDLLARVVAATRGDHLPCETWSVQTRAQYGYRIPADAPPMQQLNQIIFDLWAYRDDCHLAAWRPIDPDLTPRAWETLTTLWRGTANDAASLAEALQEHNYTADDYIQALDELITRGWIAPGEEHSYHLTDEGLRIREHAEALTNNYFYQAFDCLTEAEQHTLHAALQQVLAALQKMATS